MASNFDFLQSRFPDLFQHATHAERLVQSAPRGSCFYARFTLEQAVIWLYDHDPYLRMPYDKSLGAMIHEQSFKDNLKPGLFPKIRTIHKLGNLAVHDSGTIQRSDALHLIQELFHVMFWLCRYYSADGRSLSAQFDRALIPQPTAPAADLSQARLQELEAQLSQVDDLRRIEAERLQKTEAELATTKAELDAIVRQNEAAEDTHDYNESATRHYLIDRDLREAGWILPDAESGSQGTGQVGLEVEVVGMPTASGTGRVDYVLWGEDGKPLAVVEAKRTRQYADSGKHQAKLYADCLETQFGQRPVIFYTNGYETWLWDDRRYPPRQVQGFLKQEELERLIFRRTSRKALHWVQVKPEIVNRTYQREAIQRITETFDPSLSASQRGKGRKALLVMATGTGKTRTAIALVDVLIRANWVKRTLFLADRNALLTQAYRAFQSHLPTVTPIDLTRDKVVDSANVVLSTYPTLLNFVERTNDNGRIFGVGHFDLVIVDEAHRSIYKKYAQLFDYFDGLLVGLTATPRNEVHRDTYRIFELETGNPTFAYELNDAVNDGYLVPPKGIDVPFKFLRSGVKYADLSADEKVDYEEKFRNDETGAIPDQVNAAALNRWLFNKNTVDQALAILMERGLKIDGGDRLGKTIIFARNHDHADFIVQRFNKSYPNSNGHFAQVIDSHNAQAQSLLDEFGDANKDPTIAVSVDMLDTGIDIPEVVNLVFFKPVYSRVKFNQMIGRGTRLCPDLFGIGLHKTEFRVFDLCGNFDYFSQTVAETDQTPVDSLTTRLMKARLELATLLADPSTTVSDPAPVATTDSPSVGEAAGTYPKTTAKSDAAQLRDRLLNDLHQHVATMEPNNILVRPHLQHVEEFTRRDRWQSLTEDDQTIITTVLAHLPNGLPTGDRLAKDFDLLCYKLQLSLLKRTRDFIRLRDQLRDLMSLLEQKRDVPMIKPHLALIADIQTENWWTDVTPWMVDDLRLTLRDLVKFIDKQQQFIVYTNFQDTVGDIQSVDVPIETTGFSPYQYRKKVEAYIRAHENHLAIAKLKRNDPLTDTDLDSLNEMLFSTEALEGRDRFEEVYGKDISLKLFIRKLVGLDRNTAKQAFAAYLEGTQFSANQIRFVETIIDYLTQNGVMDIGLLYEPPFTDAHPDGVDGIFDDPNADRLIDIVRSFNQTVGATFDVA